MADPGGSADLDSYDRRCGLGGNRFQLHRLYDGSVRQRPFDHHSRRHAARRGRGFGGRCGRGYRSGDKAPLTDAQKQALQQAQQDRQAKRDAALKALRDKMTPEDQTTFDQLQSTATQQRTAMKQTMDQLRTLMQKYGAIGQSGNGPSTTTPDSSGTTPSGGGGTSTTTGSSI